MALYAIDMVIRINYVLCNLMIFTIFGCSHWLRRRARPKLTFAGRRMAAKGGCEVAKSLRSGCGSKFEML